MVKSLTISFILLFTTSVSTIAQHRDPDEIKKTAIKDARKFKLSKTDFANFRKTKPTKSSDLFKPKLENASQFSLLSDSAYVNAYRDAAYFKTQKRKTVGHHFLIWGVAVVAAPTIVYIGLGGG